MIREFYTTSSAVCDIIKKKRFLLWEMSRLDLRDRYVGQAFGLFWAIFVPLLTMFVYLFVFAMVFKVKLSGTSGTGAGWGGSYALYLLSGLIPWMSLQEVLTRSSTIITGNANLVKQVVFPLEVLPLKIFGPPLLTQGIALVVYFTYGCLRFGAPGALVLALPFVFVCQMFLSMGCALIFSSVGVFLRDIKDITGILCFLLVYALPIFYSPTMVPERFSLILQCNPLTHMITMYHDVLFFGQVTCWHSWYIFPAFAIAVWFIGCRTFEALKPFFGNVL